MRPQRIDKSLRMRSRSAAALAGIRLEGVPGVAIAVRVLAERVNVGHM
jgi:hypothetical protein